MPKHKADLSEQFKQIERVYRAKEKAGVFSKENREKRGKRIAASIGVKDFNPSNVYTVKREEIKPIRKVNTNLGF